MKKTLMIDECGKTRDIKKRKETKIRKEKGKKKMKKSNDKNKRRNLRIVFGYLRGEGRDTK